MTKTLSLFLDAVRFVAALLVVFHHGAFDKFGSGIPHALGRTGLEPVIVFFVLSGFVIAYTAEAKDKNLRDYAASRFARIASVAWPAVVLTLVCDALGARIGPALYADHWNDPTTLANIAQSPWVTYATTALFVNGFWWLDYWPGTNSPFWSLSYEVAYYVLFAFGFYLRGKIRIVSLTIGVFVVGPKILLLAPVWFMGVATWRAVERVRVAPLTGGLLMTAALALYAGYLKAGGPGRMYGLFMAYVPDGGKYGAATMCLSTYVTGALFCLLIFGFSGAQATFERGLIIFARPIRALAALTFTAYLLHYPILYLVAAVSRRFAFGPLFVLSGLAIAIYAVAKLTEQQKHLVRSLVSKSHRS